jgi:Tfp pilus assembly protein PilO
MKLSKREILLLSALLAVALIFGGYRFLYMPIQEKLATLAGERETSVNQLALVQADLATLESYQGRRTAALADIKTKSVPFFATLPVESVLLYLHDTVLASGLQLGGVSVEPEQAIRILIPTTTTARLTYPITEIAKQYRDLENPPVSPTPTPTPAATSDTQPGTVADLSVQLTLSGSYIQVKDFLSRIESLDRSIVVKQLSISSASGTGTVGGPVIPSGITIQLDFFGIDKIVDQTDPIFDWNRTPVSGKPDPFA